MIAWNNLGSWTVTCNDNLISQLPSLKALLGKNEASFHKKCAQYKPLTDCLTVFLSSSLNMFCLPYTEDLEVGFHQHSSRFYGNVVKGIPLFYMDVVSCFKDLKWFLCQNTMISNHGQTYRNSETIEDTNLVKANWICIHTDSLIKITRNTLTVHCYVYWAIPLHNLCFWNKCIYLNLTIVLLL